MKSTMLIYLLLLLVPSILSFSEGSKMDLAKEAIAKPGTQIFLEFVEPSGRYAVVFEEDDATGYFYAVDQTSDEKIQDALHIYDIASISDKGRSSTYQILWNRTDLVFELKINGYSHAVFDFKRKVGFCRDGFPEPLSKGTWSKNGHRWLPSYEKLYQL